ncbi:O-antigen ligase family protein [Microbacterium sp.]|uniref:O-antigen ligase family protein n=1 Tax=Microbacterium sp. TaxID=51671 RepID=UPI00333E917B
MVLEKHRPGRMEKSSAAVAGSESELQIKQRKRRRLQFAVLALALLCTTTLGWAVSLFQTGRATGLIDTTASVALTPLGSTIRENFPIVLYAVAILILLTNLRSLKGRAMRGFVPALLGVLLLYVASATATQNITSTLTFLTLIALIALTVWSIGLEVGDLVVLGRIGFAIAVVSLIMAATTDKAWSDEGEMTKGLLTDATLAGFFPQMNPLGMSMAITLPFVFMFKRRWVRVAGFAAVALTLLMASSRTAIIAAAIGLAVGIVLRITRRRSRVFLGYVAVILILTVSVVVPVTAGSGAFTGRGDIWHASLSLIPDKPIWGYGPSAYMHGGAVSNILGVAHWHGHNMWITFMVIGGVVGLVALALFWFPALHTSLLIAREGNLVPATALMTTLALGIAEVQIRPSEFDGVAWVSWVSLFAIAMLVRKPREATQEG